MNNRVRLLDCTLRDGGFINNWKFGRSTARAIFNRLASAEVDIIEMGFIDSRKSFDINSTIQPDTDSFTKIFGEINAKKSMKVAMIDYGTCPIQNIKEQTDSILDGIRVIFKKKDYKVALEYCKQIKDKGYEIFVQPVSITSYTDYEMLCLIQEVNKINPFAFSIVDTYGLMHREKLIRYFYMIDNNLNEDASIGFHSHNNFQLAYSNSIELLSINTQRTIVLDGSCYGMGKGAGNANTELLALFLNENCNKKYDINSLLEAIDVNIMPIYQKNYWGYSLKYFLSASNDCHPSYVKYLVDKKTLSVKSINDILSDVEEDMKLIYDECYIEQKYIDYQRQVIDDKNSYESLWEELKNRNILLLAPGKMLNTQWDKVEKEIHKSDPIIISVNFLPKDKKVDYVFISNAKRYIQLADQKETILKQQKIILTSNISETDVMADYIFNYETLLNNVVEVADTSMIMIIKLLSNMGIKDVNLAGFDGFLEDGTENYLETDLMFEADMKYYQTKNDAINIALKEFEHMNLNFITKTFYQWSK